MRGMDSPIVFSFPRRKRSLSRNRRLSRGKAGYKEDNPIPDIFIPDNEDAFTFKIQNSPPGRK
jgi:hypothetical protein